MRRVALTGAGGNFGSLLAKEMKTDEVLEVTRKNSQDFFKDSRDIDLFIHAAADILSNPFDHSDEFTRSNLSLTLTSLNYARCAGVKKFVYISSAAVYGDNELCCETEKDLKPISILGKLKLLNESIVEDYCLQHKIDFLIIRPFNLFGGRDRFSVFSRLLHCLEKKEKFRLINQGRSVRDFIHVADAAHIAKKIIDLESHESIYNIGSGVGHSVSEFLPFFQERGLEFQELERPEIERSVAQVERMKMAVPDVKLLRVSDFIQNELNELSS